MTQMEHINISNIKSNLFEFLSCYLKFPQNFPPYIRTSSKLSFQFSYLERHLKESKNKLFMIILGLPFILKYHVWQFEMVQNMCVRHIRGVDLLFNNTKISGWRVLQFSWKLVPFKDFCGATDSMFFYFSSIFKSKQNKSQSL